MLQTNKSALPIVSAIGRVASVSRPPFRGLVMDENGVGHLMQSAGGIVYNFKIGDLCSSVLGDRIAPGITTCGISGDEDRAYRQYCCVGNEAWVRGSRGFVVGKTCNGVILSFAEPVLRSLSGMESFLVKSCGAGLELTDAPEIMAGNIDPRLLEKIVISVENGSVYVPAAAVLPAEAIGIGKGSVFFSGSCEVMSSAEGANKADELRFGDFVIIEDLDATHGCESLRGAATLAVVIHSKGMSLGSGVGLTVLLSSKRPLIHGIMGEKANLCDYLDFGEEKEDA